LRLGLPLLLAFGRAAIGALLIRVGFGAISRERRLLSPSGRLGPLLEIVARRASPERGEVIVLPGSRLTSRSSRRRLPLLAAPTFAGRIVRVSGLSAPVPFRVLR
jgi:hypothetical protein